MGGATTFAQDSIKSTSKSFWNLVPTISSVKALDFDLSNCNKSLVNFAVVFGIFTLAKSSIHLAKSALASRPNKVPTKQQLLDKYGHLAWALIADCKDNQQYYTFLAKNGFNLILMGHEEDVRKARETVQSVNPNIMTQSIVVDWAKVEIDLKYYEDLVKQLQNHDIAFLILPKLVKEKDVVPTHLQNCQPFQHIYLLVRYFGARLKFRSYKSAIVFPSFDKIEETEQYNGVSTGLIAGSDAFGRIIAFELKGAVEIVVARGSVENAFAGLGIQKITY